MFKKVISICIALTLVFGLGLLSSATAEAAPTSASPNSSSAPVVVKPYFVPPTDGGGSIPPSLGERVCTEIHYISGWVDVLDVVGKVNKWVKVAVYSSTVLCTIVYR
jgi:hypothetical protein